MFEKKPAPRVLIEVEVRGRCDEHFANWFITNLQSMIGSMPLAMRQQMDLESIELIGIRKV